jgi:hypothetical protein
MRALRLALAALLLCSSIASAQIAVPLGPNGGASGGGAAPSAANPTATAGPAAVNGVATTFLRSDGAPAVQKGSNAQFGLVECDNVTTVCPSGVIALKPAGAVLQQSPANPTGSASTTGLMQGLGSTCQIAPLWSTRIKVEFIGITANSTISQTIGTKVFWGTVAGGVPVNGAAPTGTQVGTNIGPDSGTANFHYPFVNGGIVSGLTPGTNYWIDMSLLTTGGTATIISISCNAFEF